MTGVELQLRSDVNTSVVTKASLQTPNTTGPLLQSSAQSCIIIMIMTCTSDEWERTVCQSWQFPSAGQSAYVAARRSVEWKPSFGHHTQSQTLSLLSCTERARELTTAPTSSCVLSLLADLRWETIAGTAVGDMVEGRATSGAGKKRQRWTAPRCCCPASYKWEIPARCVWSVAMLDCGKPTCRCLAPLRLPRRQFQNSRVCCSPCR